MANGINKYADAVLAEMDRFDAESAPAQPETTAATPAAVEPPTPPADTPEQSTEPVQEPEAASAEQSEPAADETDEASEDASAEPPPTAGSRRGVSWKTRYQELQSFNDRRYAQQQAQIAELQAKLGALSPAQTPSVEDLGGQQLDPEVDAASRQAVRSTLEKDYGLDQATMAAIRLPAEVQKYRAKHSADPNLSMYDPVVLRVVEELAGNEPITEQHLTRAYKVSRKAVEAIAGILEAQNSAAKQTAPARPEAATTKSQTVAATTKTPLTPEVRAQLQANSQTLSPEKSVGLEGTPKRQGKDFHEKAVLAVLDAMEKVG